MMKKIVFTGPESSGKTTLSKHLSEILEIGWVPEYARQFLHDLGRPYQKEDLVSIAQGQLALEEALIQETSPYLICDTDLLTIKIWSEYKYGDCDARILELIENRHYDMYFLCSPDIPWVDDPLRESPQDRSDLYDLYKSALIDYGKKFVELRGNEKERLARTLSVLKSTFGE